MMGTYDIEWYLTASGYNEFNYSMWQCINSKILWLIICLIHKTTNTVHETNNVLCKQTYIARVILLWLLARFVFWTLETACVMQNEIRISPFEH